MVAPPAVKIICPEGSPPSSTVSAIETCVDSGGGVGDSASSSIDENYNNINST